MKFLNDEAICQRMVFISMKFEMDSENHHIDFERKL
jgi:hypothetical protein